MGRAFGPGSFDRGGRPSAEADRYLARNGAYLIDAGGRRFAALLQGLNAAKCEPDNPSHLATSPTLNCATGQQRRRANGRHLECATRLGSQLLDKGFPPANTAPKPPNRPGHRAVGDGAFRRS